jgi:hypothetical protein
MNVKVGNLSVLFDWELSKLLQIRAFSTNFDHDLSKFKVKLKQTIPIYSPNKH